MDHECIYTIIPILYYDALSSQSRSCQMLIKMLKIDVELRSTDSIRDINFNETYTWLNSFCMLPTLIDGNVTLCNSHSILIYLCEKFAPLDLANLCPRDYISRLRVMSVLFYEGCILHRCLGLLLSDIFLSKYLHFNKDYHRNKVSNIYKTLNSFLNRNYFMVGNRLTIADISLVSTVAALNIIYPIYYTKFSNLFDWLQRLKKMEFYESNEEGLQKLRYFLKKVGKFPFPSPFGNEKDSYEQDLDDDSDNSDLKENSNSEEENESDLIRKKSVLDDNNRRVSKPSDSSNVKPLSKADKNTSTESLVDIFDCETAQENGRPDYDPEKFNFYNDICLGRENGNHFLANNYTICDCWENAYKSHEFEEKIDCCCFQTPLNPKDLRPVEEYRQLEMKSDIQDCQPSYSRSKKTSMRNQQMPDVSCFQNLLRKVRNLETILENSKLRITDKLLDEKGKQVNRSNIKNNLNKNPLLDSDTSFDSSDDLTTKGVNLENAIKVKTKHKNDPKCDNLGNTEPIKFANLDIENLLQKVRSLEKILERTDKISVNMPKIRNKSKRNSKVETKVSSDSSLESLTESAENLEDDFENSKSEITVKVPVNKRKRKYFSNDSSTKSLKEGNVDNQRNSKNDRPSHHCDNSSNNLFQHKRLEAGCNPKPIKDSFIEYDLPNTSNQSKQWNMENNDKITQLIYHINMRNESKYNNKYHCDICLKKQDIKVKKSKIPRFISNRKRCKINLKDIGCDCPNKESLQNVEEVR